VAKEVGRHSDGHEQYYSASGFLNCGYNLMFRRFEASLANYPT
jgi:hypothetical protein